MFYKEAKWDALGSAIKMTMNINGMIDGKA